MRAVSDFTPVWEVARQSRKRKHASEVHDPDIEEGSLDPGSDEDTFRNESVLPKSTTDPYHVAGHDPREPLPPQPFPHGSGEPISAGRKSRSQTIAQDIHASSLHQRHLSIMTSILHTSLSKGDFARASRAWSALMRSTHGGQPLDLRRHGLWGIGAEILLRGDHVKPKQSDQSLTSGIRSVSRGSSEAAIDFYEQLILQMPYSKQHANTIDSRTFYPAMFSIMINEATEMSRRAIARIQDTSSDSPSPAGSLDEPSDEESKAQMADVKRSELDSAKKIVDRMEEILISPPYDKFTPLLQLRGMVGVWLADLHKQIAALSEESDAEDDRSPNPRLDSYSLRLEASRHKENEEVERRKARQYFSRVVRNGGILPGAVKDLLQQD